MRIGNSCWVPLNSDILNTNAAIRPVIRKFASDWTLQLTPTNLSSSIRRRKLNGKEMNRKDECQLEARAALLNVSWSGDASSAVSSRESFVDERQRRLRRLALASQETWERLGNSGFYILFGGSRTRKRMRKVRDLRFWQDRSAGWIPGCFHWDKCKFTET